MGRRGLRTSHTQHERAFFDIVKKYQGHSETATTPYPTALESPPSVVKGT